MENLSEGKSGCHTTAGKSAAQNPSQIVFEKKILCQLMRQRPFWILHLLQSYYPFLNTLSFPHLCHV